MSIATVESATNHSLPPSRRLRFSPFGRAKPLHLFMAAGLYLFFAVFLVWPIVQICKVGFVNQKGDLTADYVKLVFHDPLLVRGLINATVVAICVTAVTLLISLPMSI